MQWSKNMRLIDANVMLRYLLNDVPEMAQQAKAVIESGAYTRPEIIAEVVYVLKGVYQVSREEIRTYIRQLLRQVRCTETNAVIYAADIYAAVSLDFVDCLLVAYHVLRKDNVFTFDKKLSKYLLEPPIR